ncbi:hypothetical protein C7J88_04995 [Staphylococcus muscae]|uniref:Lytic regulatory protein n=1 Tax=Staphylococcus muscae TaxID=1294 RepID=A0A240C6U6_9STAP|nr:hypothetical protein [Staphylococcus muscae]AVQ33558.1 hypothetical protein C7J88_04995 [Staphylococcus muscae]PNZ01025.1 hypothetical protein CD131_09625 [Staphylococcus muscae]GGA91432.1 hypothetical protein GCM10007183_14550 [Staphylococcus muscae]SNW03519.1 lytic regulatory protein [Staphylococcus muscae]
MFKFTSLFLEHTKLQRKKLYSMNLVNFLLMLILLSLSVLPMGLIFNLWAMAFFTGQGNTMSLILVTMGALLLIALIFLMITFPLFVGTIRSMYQAITQQATLKWSVLFSTFNGKIWRKSLLVGLVTSLFLLVLVIIDYFITMGLRQLLKPLVSSNFTEMMILFVIAVISSIISVFIAIFIINFITAFVKNPDNKIRHNIKIAWTTIKNGQKTFLPFLIGLYLLNLTLLIFAGPVFYGIQMSQAHISQNLASIITGIVSAIFFFIRYTVYFIMLGTIITYFHHQGHKNVS